MTGPRPWTKEGLTKEFWKARQRALRDFERVFFSVPSEEQVRMFQTGYFAGWMEAGGTDPRR